MLFATTKWGLCGLILLFAATQARAEVHLDSSRVWGHAGLLTVGQNIWSFQTSYQETSDRFSAEGKLEPLGQNYSRQLTWNQLLKSESAQGRADLRAYMRQHGVRETDVAATASYAVERSDVGFEINWAYGLTQNWMIGLTLPFTLRTTRVRESMEMSPALISGLHAQSQSDVGGRVQQLAQSELANSGYDRIPDQKQTWNWGDISLLSQNSLWQNSRAQISLQERVNFPTAQSPSLGDYIQNSDDQGQVDLGVTLLADYRLGRLKTSARTGYVMQLPDTTRVHTDPREGAESKSSQTVSRDLGDWVWSSLEAQYKVAKAWELSVEHAFLSKARDAYAGDTLSGSDQQLQQSRLGVLYHITGTGLRNGVLSRWTTAVNVTYPWIGRNTSNASQTSLEVLSYF